MPSWCFTSCLRTDAMRLLRLSGTFEARAKQDRLMSQTARVIRIQQMLRDRERVWDLRRTRYSGGATTISARGCSMDREGDLALPPATPD